MLVEVNSKLRNIAIHRDASITRDQSEWRIAAKKGGRTIREDSGALNSAPSI